MGQGIEEGGVSAEFRVEEEAVENWGGVGSVKPDDLARIVDAVRSGGDSQESTSVV
jgi:hypothetical protein